jgi:ABC-2 type transport system permease protein
VITDILTMMWKEWRELVVHRGSLRSTLGTAAVLILLLGVVLPLRIGAPWLSSPLYLAYWGWVPSVLVSTLIADSFAGERERHTLDTLLASRLGDFAILFGKIGASVAYSCAITLALLLTGLIVVNVSDWAGSPVGPSRLMGAAAVSLTILVSLATAAAGALASLRAATVRQAQQTLNVVLMSLALVPLLGAELLPAETRNQLAARAAALDPAVGLGGAVLLLLAVDVLLVAAAAYRFRRSQLLLD